jgi:hypothetical protein
VKPNIGCGGHRKNGLAGLVAEEARTKTCARTRLFTSPAVAMQDALSPDEKVTNSRSCFRRFANGNDSPPGRFKKQPRSNLPGGAGRRISPG